MRKFTKLWQLMMIVLISSSVLMVQAQKSVSNSKASTKVELKKEFLAQFDKEQIEILSETGFTQDAIMVLQKEGIEIESLKDAETLQKAEEILMLNGIIENTKPGIKDGSKAASGYAFSQVAGTYTPITGGTQHFLGTWDDNTYSDVPIGFDFVLNGYTASMLYINANGYVVVGGNTYLGYSPISSTTTLGAGGAVAAVGRDIQAVDATSEIRSETLGTAPNRIFVIQWFYAKRYGTNYLDESFDFQIRLHETTNLVEIVYGSFVGTAYATPVHPQVGLRGTSNADFHNRTTATDWSATTMGTLNTETCVLTNAIVPASGLTFQFTPPLTPGDPFGPTPANLATGVSIATNLEWTFGANTDNYDLLFSTVNPPVDYVVTNGVASNPGSFDPPVDLAYSTTYYWQVIAKNTAGDINGPVWSFTTSDNLPGAAFNPSPTNLATGVDVDADLGWTFGVNTLTYDVLFDIVTPPVAIGAADQPAGATGTYDPGTMAYSTTYYWQVVSKNAAKAETPGPIWSFTTGCAPVSTFPFVEDFDGATFPPDCWEKYAGLLADPIVLSSTTSGWFQDDWRNIVTGDKAARLNIWTTTINYWLMTPVIDLGAGGYQLEFDLTLNPYAGSGPPDLTGVDDRFAIVMSTDGGASWSTTNTLRLYDNAGSPFVYNNINYLGETVVLDITGYTGQVQIGFYGESTVSNADNDLMINNLKVRIPPTCPDPFALGATNISTTQADLTWTSTSLDSEIEFGIAGFVPTGIPTEPLDLTSPYTKTGLSAVTSYSFYVRDDCGGGDYSAWVGPYTFSTPCATVVAPFVENFQNTTIPLCWEISGPQNWLFTNTWPAYGAAGLADHTGTAGSFAGVDGSGSTSLTDITLLTPFIDVMTNLTDPALRFYLFNNNINDASSQTLRVDLWDGAAWNNSIYFWGPADNDPNWVEVIVALSPYTITGDIQFRFVVDKSAGSPFYDDLVIDDVYVEEAPTCPNPSNLGAINITTAQADLTWVSVSLDSEIEFGIAGFVPTGIPTEPLDLTSPYTKTGLSASSSYSFYVRDDCGGGEYSAWIGPYTFATPCDAFDLPYCQTFDDLAFPLCWTQGYATGVTSDRWSVSTTNNAGGASGANEMYATWVNVIGESWLSSPEFNIPAGGAILTFDHFYDDYGLGLDLSVRYSNDGGATWTTGWTIASGAGNVGPETLNVPITLSGNVIVQWYMTGNHFQLDAWYVDDVCLIVPLAHDAKTVSVDVPGLAVPGTVVPMATVENNGTNVETFDVTMTITPGGYSSTQTVTALDPFTAIQVTFADWTATVDDYTVEVCTELATDLDPANDCLSKMVSIQELRIAYGYIAYDPSATLPEGPGYFFIQDPGTIVSLAATTSEQFISAGTWANGTWYGSEYYDDVALTGGGWWTIDPTDGTMTELGDFDLGFSGITYDPITDIMYGTFWDGVNDVLYTVDPATGAATSLGSYNTQLSINLACDGSGYLYSIGLIDDQLYQIDPTTVPPTAVAVGPTGYAFNFGQDMEYDFENDIMYAAGYHTTGELMTVDLTTGACTPLGVFQGGAEITGFALPYDLGFRVYGNVYYGHSGTTKPMETMTTVTLTPGSTVSSGALGAYELSGLVDGVYDLVAETTKPYDFGGGVANNDALYINRYVLGNLPMVTIQKRAADVNFNNDVAGNDALLIKRRVLGNITSWPGINLEWVFSTLGDDMPFGTPNPINGPKQVTVSGADVMLELRMLETGDVNGNYNPPAK